MVRSESAQEPSARVAGKDPPGSHQRAWRAKIRRRTVDARGVQDRPASVRPRRAPASTHASESQKLAMLKLSRCMRAHGVTSFPDPTNKRPSPGNGPGIAFGGGGSFIAVPQSLTQSPGFKQAAATCHFPGFGDGGRPKAVAAG